MPEQSKLLEFNPQLEDNGGVFQDKRDRFRPSTVSNSLQIGIGEAYAAANDKSLYSLDLERLMSTDQLRDELNPEKYSFLVSFDFTNISQCLDLTEDFGGVLHFLSHQVSQLDAVRIDRDRARLCAQRCEDLGNISLVCEDLHKLKFPKNHYQMILIGELELLNLDQAAQSVLFAKLRDALTSDGVLLVNSSNHHRLAKWLDGATHHRKQEIPYQALYSLDNDQSDYPALKQNLHNAGLNATSCFASFSAGNKVNNLLAEDYLNECPDVLNHFYRLGAIQNDQVCEYLLFRQAAYRGGQVLQDCASRFVVLAGRNLAALEGRMALAFAHYPGKGRRPHWRTITEYQGGSAPVTKRPLYAPSNGSDSSQGSGNTSCSDSHSLVEQNLSSQTHLSGRLLIARWLDACLQQQPDEFKKLVVDYATWLNGLHETLGTAAFNATAYDLLPFNVLEQADKSDEHGFQTIDAEWVINTDISPDFVLFRALFWFSFENKPLLRAICETLCLPTIEHFVRTFHPHIETSEQVNEFALLEEKIQIEIGQHFRAGAVSHALGQPLSVSVPSEEESGPQQLCQLQWGDHTGKMDEADARFLSWEENDQEATLLSIALPPWKSNHTHLRIDPIACTGLFRVEAIELITKAGELVLSLNSAAACVAASELHNIRVSDDGETCIALNSDPHFILDLTEQPNLSQTVECRLKLKLEYSDAYHGALKSLSNALNQQSDFFDIQIGQRNRLLAELDFTEKRLSDAVNHREDLNRIVNELIRESRAKANLSAGMHHHEQLIAQENHRLNRRLKHLNDQLIDQIKHNHAMDRHMMQRPSTRAKRLLARLMRRALGKPPVIDVADDLNDAIEPKLDAAEATQSSTESTESTTPTAQEEELIGQNLEDYQLWLQQNALSEADISAAEIAIENLPNKPLFSILVPVYNTDPDYLIPMIRSVQAQIYPHWQLVLVDDCSPKESVRTILEDEAAKDQRITLQLNQENKGIALTSNDALALATGDYIGLLDHDDELSIDALYENAKVINDRPDAGLIYSDEDKMDMQGNRLEPYFKPDYSPDLLDTNNYICHFTVIKKSIVDQIGGFREGVDGSQDHDIVLRAIYASEQVVHIPKILYHWRKIPGSTAVQYDSKSYAWEAGRVAVEECLHKRDDSARVEFGSLKGTYRIFREINGKPLVSIIIPFKDKPELLDACIGSILEKTSYRNFEIVGVSNNSENPATFERMEYWAASDPRVRFSEKNIPFNFSAICNYGVSQATGEYVLLLNNDVTVDNADWLERLLEHAQRAEVGAVGGKLLYPDNRIQHAGIVAGMVGAAGHPHKFFPDNHIGYHGRLHMVYNVSAVTGAMLMVRTDKYLQVGGLDEQNLAVAYNDVDFCLKLLSAGYLNVFTPHSRGIHHESVSRGYEDTDEKLARLTAEQTHFTSTWADFLAAGDPYYNPNLSLLNERFSLKFEEERNAK